MAQPTSISAMQFVTPKTVVGTSPRQVEGHIFSVRFGVLTAAARAVDSVSIPRRGAQKIMLEEFAVPSTAVRIEGTTS
jgi:hypothetical protein